MRAVEQVAAGPNHPNRAIELKPALQFQVSIRGQIRHAVYAGQRCSLKDEYEQTQACCHATTNRPQQRSACGGRSAGGEGAAVRKVS